MKGKKIAIILGTRPEIIKLSSIIRHCEKNDINYFILHTGQHYSQNMDKVFFEELELPQPKYNLNVGSGLHGKQTGIMLEKIEKVLMDERPDAILVQGDTNTVLAGALAASKLGIKVGHVEAGLRSYDRTMPEEINRVITDHISDFLFCPTENPMKIAIGEGISKDKIVVVGNTIVDAVQQNLELANKKSNIMSKLGLKSKNYILLTAHRPGNVDVKENLRNLLKGIASVSEISGMKVVCPLHPRTKKMMDDFGLRMPDCVNVIDPLGFLEFLQLEANAKLILTDSGGVQEEACILHVPSVTLRENTERPETLDVGASMLAGCNQKKIIEYSKIMIGKKTDWKNPFGDGKSGERIIRHLFKKL